jgi:hypothetical protein
MDLESVRKHQILSSGKECYRPPSRATSRHAAQREAAKSAQNVQNGQISNPARRGESESQVKQLYDTLPHVQTTAQRAAAKSRQNVQNGAISNPARRGESESQVKQLYDTLPHVPGQMQMPRMIPVLIATRRPRDL